MFVYLFRSLFVSSHPFSLSLSIPLCCTLSLSLYHAHTLTLPSPPLFSPHPSVIVYDGQPGVEAFARTPQVLTISIFHDVSLPLLIFILLESSFLPLLDPTLTHSLSSLPPITFFFYSSPSSPA